METKLKEKYGLPTAIAMVVGTVIGSGVFFKSEKILSATGGDMPLGVLAWVIGGAVMVSIMYTFSILARKYVSCGGLVDYADATVGKRYGFFIGYFIATIYFPCMTVVVCWVAAMYTSVLFGFENAAGGAQTFVIAPIYMIAVFAMNFLSPKIAGKFQISATIIKLVPLSVMAIVGTIAGLCNGVLASNFAAATQTVAGNPLLAACVATTFAYEGFLCAMNINGEIRNSKRNLPFALAAGGLIIMAVYLFYFIGISGAVDNAELIAGGESGAKLAFGNLFGAFGGTGLFVFVVVSCLGTANGVIMANSRALYSIAVRSGDKRLGKLREVSPKTNMPTYSSVVSLSLAALYFVLWFGNFAGFFGGFFLDISELPVVTLYACFVPIFVKMLLDKSEKPFNRFVAPSAAILGSAFMVYATIDAHKIAVLWYLLGFAAIMGAGLLFVRARKKESAPRP